MPIMTRMRDSMPAILFGLLIAFLITIVFEWGMGYLGPQGSGDVIGSVDGKKVTYKEFTDLVQNYAENQRAQTGAELDENQMKQVRDQVWESIVTQHLVEEQVERLGITVTDDELVDWVRGDNPPEDLRRSFVDSLGQFRRDLYEQFLSNPNQFLQDPQGIDQAFGTKWLADYEKTLRQRRLQEKLQSIVLATVRVGEGELRQRFKDQNEQYDALYALFDPNVLVKDEDVQLTDADLKAYYDENVDQYKFEASRKLKYVHFAEVPSAQDSAGRKSDIEDAAGKARSGIDFLQLVANYSDRPDSGAFYKHGDLASNIETAVFAAKVGDIVGPILDKDGYHLLKVMDERKGDRESVHASHILISVDAGSDSNAARKKALDVARMAKDGSDFEALAREYSGDPGSAQRGGDLGWFSRGRMVKPFEEAAFGARPGTVVGPVRTQFGYHIIKVHARDSREVKVAQILIAITTSSQTKNDIIDRAKDFAYNSAKTSLAQEAQSLDMEVRETQVQEKGGFVPGIGVNEGITRWAFNNKLGSISDPFSIPSGYVVMSIAEVKDAGVRPFDEVKESLRPLALRKKKLDRAREIASAARAKLSQGDSLTKIEGTNPSVQVQRTGSFTLGGSIAGLGRDLNFIGAVEGLTPGEVSKPVQGIRGAFLIQLLTKTNFDSTAYNTQREALRNQMLQEKRNRFLTEWIGKLKEDATIEDNREVYFR